MPRVSVKRCRCLRRVGSDCFRNDTALASMSMPRRSLRWQDERLYVAPRMPKQNFLANGPEPNDIRRVLRFFHGFAEPPRLKSTRDSIHRWMKKWLGPAKIAGRDRISTSTNLTNLLVQRTAFDSSRTASRKVQHSLCIASSHQQTHLLALHSATADQFGRE